MIAYKILPKSVTNLHLKTDRRHTDTKVGIGMISSGVYLQDTKVFRTRKIVVFLSRAVMFSPLVSLAAREAEYTTNVCVWERNNLQYALLTL